jgi:hypothetical protein
MSQAEQRVNNVEVMMVLDVSGSMASNNRLVNLKVAAKDFVATVLSNDPEHKISIGMVPFNGQVNLGTTLLGQFNAINNPNATNVNCIDLPLAAYDNTTLSQYAWATTVSPATLSMTADADAYDGAGTTAPNALNKWCPPQPGNIVRLPSQTVATMQSNIDGLYAIGATSINAGLKWGLGLLDPTSRPIYTSLISGGAMDNNLAGRPFDYDDKEAMKVIVLMTDGEHFIESRVAEDKKSGYSEVYKATTDSNYSVFIVGKVNSASPATICASKPYYVPHLGAWHVRPWNGTVPPNTDCYVVDQSTIPVATRTWTQQTWPQVWAARNLQYVACYWYSAGVCNTAAYTTLLNTFRTTTATTVMDSQLQSICTLAKAQNVIIYGIAFEASTNGQTQIRNCSTDGENGSHYFNAQGLQISTAFSAIANNISQLRLTQ